MHKIKTLTTAAITTAFILLTAINASAFKGIGSAIPEESAKQGMSDGHQQSRTETVAIVNDTPITLGSLMDAMMEIIYKGGYGEEQLSEELSNRIRMQALEKLSLEELAFQHAVSLGMTADPDSVDKQLQIIINRQGGRDAYKASLANQGKTIEQTKDKISRVIAVQKAIRQEVDDKATISKEEIDQVYAENRDQFIQQEKVIITDIVFFLDPENPESLAKVNKVKNKIINELAGDPNRLTADGFIVSPNLNVSPGNKPELYKAAKNIKIGDMSDPLIIDGTLHLIKYNYLQPRTEKPEDEAKKYIASKLKTQKRQQLLTQWRNNLIDNADVEIVHELLKIKNSSETTSD